MITGPISPGQFLTLLPSGSPIPEPVPLLLTFCALFAATTTLILWHGRTPR